MGKTRTYDADGISVTFDAARCIHAAECVRGLPSVFDPERRPWIDPAGAGPDELAAVIRRCPSGALAYERSDGGPPEAPDTENVVRVVPEGPLHVRGRLRVHVPGGEALDETRVSLCRCGKSANKPFCDNAHLEVGFDDAGTVVERGLPEADADAEVLEISLSDNGPILLRGSFRVRGADADVQGGRAALCRCGGSGTKPFCDGSHRDRGFEAAGG